MGGSIKIGRSYSAKLMQKRFYHPIIKYVEDEQDILYSNVV